MFKRHRKLTRLASALLAVLLVFAVAAPMDSALADESSEEEQVESAAVEDDSDNEESEEDSLLIDMVWSDGSKDMTVVPDADTVYYYVNLTGTFKAEGTYARNGISVKLPKKSYDATRNENIYEGDVGMLLYTGSNAISNIVESSNFTISLYSGSEYFTLTNTQEVTDPEFSFKMRFFVYNPKQIIDMKESVLTATATVRPVGGTSVTVSDSIVLRVDTYVNLTSAEKSLNEASGEYGVDAFDGVYRFYSDVLNERYGYSEEDYNQDQEDGYVIVEWKVHAETEGNQPFTLTGTDTPIGGAVIGDFYSEDAYYFDSGDAYVLTKYPIPSGLSNGSMTVVNTADIAMNPADGVDASTTVTVYCDATIELNKTFTYTDYYLSKESSYPSDVDESLVEVGTSLLNGEDTDITWRSTSVANTAYYATVAPDGSVSFSESLRVETIDDIMAIETSDGDIEELSLDDFEFSYITIRNYSRKYDSKVNGSGCIVTTLFTEDEWVDICPDVYAWVEDEWIEGRWIEVYKGDVTSKFPYEEEDNLYNYLLGDSPSYLFNRSYKLRLPTGTTKVKLVSENVDYFYNVDVTYGLTLKGDGLVSSTLNKSESVTIYNSVCSQAYNADGEWMNPISYSDDNDDIEEFIDQFDTEFYEGHSYQNLLSYRAYASFTLEGVPGFKLILHKTDPDGNPLEGVEFVLYDTNNMDRNPEFFITDSDGTAVLELYESYFWLYETNAKDGYLLPDGSIDINIYEEISGELSVVYWKNGDITFTETDDGIQIINTPDTIDLTLYKTDTSGAPLSGVSFELSKFDDDDWEAREISTGEDGSVLLEGLSAGEYRLTETKALEGYALPTGQVGISVEADGSYSVFADGEIICSQTEDGVRVVNQTIYELPSAGSGGMQGFLIAGSALVIAGVAAAIWRMKKR